MTVIDCPVCNNKIAGEICGECGYARIVFPEVIPDSLTRFENERVEILRKNHNSTISALEAERKALSHAESLVAERNRLALENSVLENNIKKIERESADRLTNACEEISRLESTIADHERELINLRKEAGKTDRQSAGSKATPALPPLRGVVVIEDIRNDIRAAFPVYDGTNSYGSKPDSGLHQQLKFTIRGYIFNPVHFTIRTSDDGIIFEPGAGVEVYHNGKKIRSGVYARQADNFMLSDRVRLNICPA